MARLVYGLAIGYDDIPIGEELSGDHRSIARQGRRLMKENPHIMEVQIVRVERCTCGCGGAHPDEDMGSYYITREDRYAHPFNTSNRSLVPEKA